MGEDGEIGDPVRARRDNPVRILAWQLLVIGLAANSAGMALVDPQVVEVGSSAQQITINLQPAE